MPTADTPPHKRFGSWAATVWYRLAHPFQEENAASITEWIQLVPAKHGHLSNKVSGWHLCKSLSRESQTPSKDTFSCLTGASVESSYQKTNIQYLTLCKQKNALCILQISTTSRSRRKLIFRQKHFTVYAADSLCVTSNNESHHTGLEELSFPDKKSALKIQINLPWTNLKTVWDLRFSRKWIIQLVFWHMTLQYLEDTTVPDKHIASIFTQKEELHWRQRHYIPLKHQNPLASPCFFTFHKNALSLLHFHCLKLKCFKR